jgi:hypothetical protein
MIMNESNVKDFARSVAPAAVPTVEKVDISTTIDNKDGAILNYSPWVPIGRKTGKGVTK